jgi:hypothetical protein
MNLFGYTIVKRTKLKGLELSYHYLNNQIEILEESLDRQDKEIEDLRQQIPLRGLDGRFVSRKLNYFC